MPARVKRKKPVGNVTRKKSIAARKARATQVLNPGFTDPTFFPWRDVGAVFLSTLRPNIGAQSAFFAVQPGRSASLRQRVTLGQPGPTGRFRLIYSVLADRNNNQGVFQVSFLNTAISRTTNLNLLPSTNYGSFEIVFSSAQSSLELEFRVNGTGLRPAFMFLDTVVIIPA
ncbi:hypothetical protein [Paenibacillus methanolicus]|uniref:Uncharacterized protein n=1 Tax=Paenibacillus methanolicus TaxID=582686 RepID=A0A5S5C3A0_9BACL|nr:hypothetical protein [Paenibacillus methanolicus]TYP73098.1 hypothetical protein BCM02_10782 [Paenibacillus methanolicus]